MTRILALFALITALLCPLAAHAQAYFSATQKDLALDAFFGQARGDYVGQGQPLSWQLENALCLDYSAQGLPVQKFPDLGQGRHLEAGTGGGPCVAPSDTAGALILSPHGWVLGAAILQNAASANPTLTLFVSSRSPEPAARNILLNWASAQSAWFFNPTAPRLGFTGTADWQTAPPAKPLTAATVLVK